LANEGVAVCCGWQALVAYVNIGCYYFIGVPLGVLLGFTVDYGIKVLLIFGVSVHPRCKNHFHVKLTYLFSSAVK
jgi:hypothetical protein